MREKILKAIEKNSKISIKDLAVILDADENAIKEEIAKMEKEQIICGYTTLINWDNTSEEKVTALIEVKVSPQKGTGFDAIAEYFYNFDEVNAVYLMSGTFDFTLLIEGKTMKEISKFVFEQVATMDNVLSTATHFVLKKYKEHGTLMVMKKKDSRILV